MTIWMLYAMAVALLLGGAAHLVERVLRGAGRPGRWSWAAALVGSWVLPLHALVSPPSPPGTGAAGAGATGSAGAGGLGALDLAALLDAGSPTGSLLAAADVAAPWAWAASAALALLLAGAGVLRLVRTSRRWPAERILAERVRVSPDFGPALVGVVRPDIVLPRWLLTLGDDAVGLVLRHEAEHRSARDTLVMTLGAALVLVAPWNLPLWWHLARLRQAVELDCDGRVLAAGVAPRPYGRLLVTVGERASASRGRFPGVVPAAALTEQRSLLERRIRMITRRDAAVGGSRLFRLALRAGGVAAAAALVLVACEAPAPTVVEEAGEDTPAGAFDFEAAETTVPPTMELEKRPGETSGESASPEARRFSFREIGKPDQPLIFIDGVEARGPDALSSLDPDDIERVEVLKGGAAGALYGERARNGVIQIFLKEGG